MRIIDLADDNKELFSLCLEDWSDEAKEGAPRRARWVERALAKGLRAKLVTDDKGVIGGMIQYMPAEHSFIEGPGLHFVHCIWVHGHKKGRGDFRGSGMGTALLEAAEADAKGLGAAGMAAWGLWLPFWMRASWFKKHGYRKADRQGMSVLVWKPFTKDTQPPRWMPVGKTKPGLTPGKVTVSAFSSGWCMAMNLAVERAKRAAEEIGDKVVYREIDTFERATAAEWGQSDAVFVDGKPVRNGPPLSYEKIRAIIQKRVSKL
ncbi:MAG: GNAT family N-acetyltransferase [Deltaproteobacteria bacterium]|nr:GNAT family N-acetyltransferase [Deltaproteobacteria bacterium]